MMYSKNSRKAISLLMRHYNDIDIFVEDSSYIGVYEKLVNRMLAGSARVTSVTPLGNRNDVIEAAKADSEAGGRPRLYIIDGDLELIAHPRKRRPSHVHRLSVYSLENLLIDENSLFDYAVFCFPGKSAVEAGSAVDWVELNKKFDKILLRYIAALAVARKLDLRDSRFEIRVHSVFESPRGRMTQLNHGELRKLTGSVIARIKELAGAARYRAGKKEIFDNVRKGALSGIYACPGKSVLWQLNELIGEAGGSCFNQKAIVSYLAERCSVNNDVRLRRRLLKIARIRKKPVEPLICAA